VVAPNSAAWDDVERAILALVPSTPKPPVKNQDHG